MSLKLRTTSLNGMSPLKKGLVLVLLVGGVWYGYHLIWGGSAAPHPAGGGGGGGGVAVEAVTIKPDTLTVQLDAVGTLVGKEGIILRPEVAGRVTGILFTEGQKVEAGQPLVQLDPAISAAQVAQAEAQLSLAQRSSNRASALVGRGAGTAQAADETTSQLRVAQAELAVAKTNFDKSRIAAPFGGTVGIRQISLGDYVQPGQTLVSLQDLSAMKLDFRLPESALSHLAAGQKVQVTVSPYPGEVFEGQVTGIDPLIDEATRSIAVRAEIPNPEGKLRPGLFAKVTLTTETRPDTLFVPASAVVPMGEKFFIFVITDGKAALTPVTLGTRESDRIVVTTGLSANAQVVTAGTNKLLMRGGAAAPVDVAVKETGK
jgi:membrane fusion protein (multidrug efflux system)